MAPALHGVAVGLSVERRGHEKNSRNVAASREALPAGRSLPQACMSICSTNNAKRNGQPERDGLYGLHWGDPARLDWLRFVRDAFSCCLLFIPIEWASRSDPGAGRLTCYSPTLRPWSTPWLFHQELLDESAWNFRAPGLFLVKNTGTDFPLIALESVSTWCSRSGAFVHLDTPIIESYLDNIKTIIRPGADVIIQYSDKTKEWARKNLTFSDNDPTRMCAMITARGYRIVREDRDKLPHSSIVHFTKD